jgi:hypothetical protein
MTSAPRSVADLLQALVAGGCVLDQQPIDTPSAGRLMFLQPTSCLSPCWCPEYILSSV